MLDQELGSRAVVFVGKVLVMRSMDELVTELVTVLLPSGLTAVASGLVAGRKAASANPFHFTIWSQDWLTYYREQDFMATDPVPRWARSSGRAISWRDLFHQLPPRDRGREVIDAAARFGYTEGIIVPMRDAVGAPGAITFGGQRQAIDAHELALLAIIARAAFEAGDRIASRSAVQHAELLLSEREIECAELLVQGQSDREIGKLLRMSESTVRFHLSNARDKMGAVSRTHLAALLVAHGDISA